MTTAILTNDRKPTDFLKQYLVYHVWADIFYCSNFATGTTWEDLDKATDEKLCELLTQEQYGLDQRVPLHKHRIPAMRRFIDGALGRGTLITDDLVSKSTKHAMSRNSIVTFEQAQDWTDYELRQLPGIGKLTVTRVRAAAEELGIPGTPRISQEVRALTLRDRVRRLEEIIEAMRDPEKR